jgi:ubiquitin-like protein Pup
MAKDAGGQRQSRAPTQKGAEPAAGGTSDEVRERHEKLSDDVDAILDEIDEVLEENAEEFVRSYVQKGGQ